MSLEYKTQDNLELTRIINTRLTRITDRLLNQGRLASNEKSVAAPESSIMEKVVVAGEVLNESCKLVEILEQHLFGESAPSNGPVQAMGAGLAKRSF